MPWFVAQIFSLDGNLIASNVNIRIDFSQRGPLQAWDGNFTLPATSQFNPTSSSPILEIQLSDGRVGDISIESCMQSQATGNWNIKFESRGELK